MNCDFVDYFSGPNLGREFYDKKVTESNCRVITGQLFEQLSLNLIMGAKQNPGNPDCVDFTSGENMFEVKSGRKALMIDNGQLERYIELENNEFRNIFYVFYCYSGIDFKGCKIWDYIKTACATINRCIIVPARVVYAAEIKKYHYGKWALYGREFYHLMNRNQYCCMANGYSDIIFNTNGRRIFRIRDFQFIKWKVKSFFVEIYSAVPQLKPERIAK